MTTLEKESRPQAFCHRGWLQARVMKLGDRALNLVRDEPVVPEEERTVGFPPAFLQWLSMSRVMMFDQMLERGARSITSQPSHLAAMATVDRDSGRINLATKGWGPLPRTDVLEAITKEFEASATSPDLEERINAARRFYSHPSSFDPSLLGGLEIFEGRTYHNLLKDGHASLLFTGSPPEYPSYQFDGVVTVIAPLDPRYEFLLQARLLFGGDPFHVHQTNYCWGYLFRPTSFRAKTPFSRR